MSNSDLKKAERAAMLEPRKTGGVLLTFAIVVAIAALAAAIDFAIARTGVPLWERPGAALVIGVAAGAGAALAGFVLRFALARAPAEEGARDVRDRA